MRGASLLFIFLFPLVKCDLCPSNYQQISSGGDCYQIKTFYDYIVGIYKPKSFDEVDTICNKDGGGLLASVHSKADNDDIIRVKGCDGVDGGNSDIGLRCKGKVCKWDDGSPVTYTNFDGAGKCPSDDGQLRCYYIYSRGYELDNGTWFPKGCGEQDQDCWVCRVKARTIDCLDGETEYKGGCVSVHSNPLDQKTAEESCPGGGHLVSIHSIGSGSENEFYGNLALASGVTGTIYIGGKFSNGAFEWIDGSRYYAAGWANGFPNSVFGSCVQMLLDSEFGNRGQWTNIDCTVKQPYICFRDGSVFEPPSGPEADPRCPPIQYFSGSGTNCKVVDASIRKTQIYSPNYPLSIPSQQNCEYVIGTSEGTEASVKFPVFDCQSGTFLSLFDGLNSNQPFATFTTTSPSTNQYYSATSNVIKIVFSANGTAPPVGTGWEADFTGIFSV